MPGFEGYASGLLAESTAAWRVLVDELGDCEGPAGREVMRRAFMVSARYEYMFWTMAYSMERWPVGIEASDTLSANRRGSRAQRP